MKILFLTTQFPYPLDNGGKIGALSGLDVLKEHEVYLLSFTEQPQYVSDGIEFLSKRLPNLHIVPPIVHDIHIQRKPLKLVKNVAAGLFGKYPYMVAKFRDPAMLSAIDDILLEQSVDIVFIDYLNMQSYGEYIKGKYGDRYKLNIFKDHNIEFELFRQEAENSGSLKRLVLNPLWKRTRMYEIKAVEQADLVFTVCEENADFFKQYNKRSYAMLPAYEMLPSCKDKESNKKLLYIGNLSWKPNLDGLKWFVSEVFPKVRARDGEITLDLIGGGLEEDPFPGVPGVRWHGYVDDISDIYRHYSVFVVPLMSGSGIRIKILEAFNNEIAVVSTSIGCGTIGAADGVHIMIADTTETFAYSIAKLLEDDAFRDRMRQNAKEFLRRKYSIESRRAEFDRLLNAMSRERRIQIQKG